MLPLSALREDPRLAAAPGLATDLDDTLTWHGALVPDAVAELHALAAEGLPCVLATGRPLGWAEVLLRTLPLRAAVTENGGACVLREGRALRVAFAQPEAERKAHLARLHDAARTLMQRFPSLAPTQDLTLRATDVTLDVGESVRVEPSVVQDAVEAAHELGLYTVVSTVHLHLSVREPDKFQGLRACVAALGMDPETLATRWLYVGDSPNDAGPFAQMTLTVGVANVRDSLAKLPVPPRYVTEEPGGHGFAALSRALREARRAGAPA